MIRGLRYFSVAVRDLDEALTIYRDMLGMKQRTDVRDTKWGFKNIMLGDDEKNMVELVKNEDPNSALGRFMASRKNPLNPEGEGLYIVSIEVDDLKKTVERIKAKGGRVTLDPENPTTAWVHPLSTRYAFLELYEAPKDGTGEQAASVAKPATRRTAPRRSAANKLATRTAKTAAPAGAPTRSASAKAATTKKPATRSAAKPARKVPAKPATRRSATGRA